MAESSYDVVLPAIVPTVYVGIYAIAGWPTWVALSADVPRAVVWIAGTLTIAYTAVIVRAVTPAVCTPAAEAAVEPARAAEDRWSSRLTLA